MSKAPIILLFYLGATSGYFVRVCTETARETRNLQTMFRTGLGYTSQRPDCVPLDRDRRYRRRLSHFFSHGLKLSARGAQRRTSTL